MNVIPVHFEFEDDRPRRRILYEDGSSEGLAVTMVGTDLYRLEESSFAGDGVYGDVIRCKPTSEGALLFEEIAERSKLITQEWVMSRESLASDHVRAILDSVMAAGGMWEQAFGGLLIVHTPVEIAEATRDRLKGDSPKT